MNASTETDTLVIGAGPGGLAVAACLQERGVRPLLIDRAQAVGASWRAHYDRLHLHTVKTHSALPGLPFPASAPRYVPRQGVVDYLEAYARHHGIVPEWAQQVVRIEPAPIRTSGGRARWLTHTAAGRQIAARHVVLATGANRVPRRPSLPGQAVFRGTVLHSGDYRRAAPFAGQRVLVLGMGNTGAEIALDLAEQGVAVALSVRSPVNIVRRDVLGRPSQLSGLLLSRLPTGLGDALAILLRQLTVGDLARWGLRTADASPLRQLSEEGRTPVIDVGTLARIQAGEIAVHPGIASLLPHGVRFTDGSEVPFDTVLLATGYGAALGELMPDVPLALDARGLPLEMIGRGALAGLYFLGFDVRQPGGLLRTIAAQSPVVAARIAGNSGPTERVGG